MKPLAFRLGLTFLLIAFLMTNIQAGDCEWINQLSSDRVHQEFTKTIKKEFAISANGTTSLTNKYGKMEVKTWDKNRVKVEVTIVVKSGTEEQAQEVFNRININFSNGDDFVKAETDIESAKKNWWGWGDDKTEFKINYEVYLPETGNLDLTNKYGNAEIGAIGGKANITVKYGDFQLEEAGNDLSVNLGYGAGLVAKAKDVIADIAYSKFRVKEAEECVFTTRYSKITTELVGNIKAESRYDNYDIGKANEFKCNARYGDVDIKSVENVVCNSQYTEYYIQKVVQSADFDLRYGGVIVEELEPNFKAVNLVGKYADYKLAVASGTGFRLDASAEYAGIKYPSNMEVTYEKEKDSSHAVKGHKGNGSGVIKASLNYGGLRVKNN